MTMRMKLPFPTIDKSLTELTDGDGQKLSIGNYVYYIADKETFAIKRGVVKEIHQKGHQFMYEIILTLEDGATLKHSHSFLTMDEALCHAIEELKQRITNRKVHLESELKKMRTDERLVEILMKHRTS